MSTSKLFIAAAGSGKTTKLVEMALAVPKTENVLITTFTEANTGGIREKLIAKNRYIPSNITIMPWFSFLLRHCVKPYQGSCFDMWDEHIEGVVLPDGSSASQIPETDKAHFFTSNKRIYTDKLSKFAIKCNVKDQIVTRMKGIFQYLFIDEIQDLAGYDLDLLELLVKSQINLVMVGDPRQSTYLTSHQCKNSKYSNGKIKEFITDKKLNVEIDERSLSVNYRCCSDICVFSNKLYPSTCSSATSGNTKTSTHLGVFLVKKSDIPSYITVYNPTQLRYDKRKNITPAFNLGESKGLEWDRVLIYPTKEFLKWMKDNATDLAEATRAKFYVGITRARYSVGIVCDDDICDIEKFIP